MDEFDVDIEGDQEALDTILHNKVLCERKMKGRTTLETMSMSHIIEDCCFSLDSKPRSWFGNIKGLCLKL
jgi:hypothetical protein